MKKLTIKNFLTKSKIDELFDELVWDKWIGKDIDGYWISCKICLVVHKNEYEFICESASKKLMGKQRSDSIIWFTEYLNNRIEEIFSNVFKTRIIF